MTDLYEPAAPRADPNEQRRAALYTASMAHDASDLYDLLQALGLTPDPEADANRQHRAEVNK